MSTKEETPAPTEPEEIDEYEGWNKYDNNVLGYSFRYPSDWTIDANGVHINSPNLKTKELQIGAIDVTSGSRVTMYEPTNGKYNTFIGLQQQLKQNGTINPVDISLGGRDGIEYSFAYEGPKTTYIRLELETNKYIDTSFMSEGNEQSHPDYEIYKLILASIEY